MQQTLQAEPSRAVVLSCLCAAKHTCNAPMLPISSHAQYVQWALLPSASANVVYIGSLATVLAVAAAAAQELAVVQQYIP
jgi:hypothetical protein